MRKSSPTEPRILITEAHGFSTVALRALEALGEVVAADLTERSALIEALDSTTVLWVRLRHRIDAEIIGAAPHLRLIVTPTTGLNHIDLAAAESRGITVLSLKGRTDFLRKVSATAEHTIALMLALLRHLPRATAHVTDGGWNRDLFRGRELDGKTVGLVGLGRLGRLVAGYLRVFGVRLLAHDTAAVTPAHEVTLVPLATLLAESDIVSLHAAYSAADAGFFDCFSAMKPGALFINTARGELIDEDALLSALRSGHLGGAALDVLADEDARGMADHPLVAYARDHDNLIITPHIGGCTFESMTKTEEHMAEVLTAALAESS